MARKTKEESQKTRDGILDAAERVFLEKGVGTTAMADLADAAGVSRGAVYGHYKNKAATPWETLRRVILPGILGHVLTGVRLAIGILWIVLVPCEMLGVSAGLGYYILDTRDRLAYSELMAMVLLIGLLGYLLDAAARGLYRRWAHGALG